MLRCTPNALLTTKLPGVYIVYNCKRNIAESGHNLSLNDHYTIDASFGFSSLPFSGPAGLIGTSFFHKDPKTPPRTNAMPQYN